MGDGPRKLAYAPRSDAIRDRRRRWLVRFLIVLAAAGAVVTITPSAMRRFDLLTKQRAVLQFQAAGPIVTAWAFENASGFDFLPGYPVPPLSTYFQTLGLYDPHQPVLFCHERKTANGKSYLVIVSLAAVGTSQNESPRGFYLAGEAIKPAGVFSPAEPTVNPLGSNVRVATFTSACTAHFGQADPHDPRHFTIDLNADNQRITVDGWLRDGGLIEFQPGPPVPTPNPATVPAWAK